MSWGDLSPAVRGFIVVGVVLLASLFAFRSCAVSAPDTPPPPRGPQR